MDSHSCAVLEFFHPERQLSAGQPADTEGANKDEKNWNSRYIMQVLVSLTQAAQRALAGRLGRHINDERA